MPSLSQLEYIVAVHRLKHFGKAAESCHVAQPSLSMQIQKAEEELGVVIFDRNKKPITPTPKGEIIIEHAKKVLHEHAILLKVSKEKEDELSGEFRLGIIPTLAPYVLPLFLEEFSKTYPQIELIVDELKTDEIVDQINHDLLDAGILATPLKEKGIREAILFYEPFLLYVNSNDPLSKKKKIRESDLNIENIWLLKEGHCLRNQVTNFCAFKKEKMGEGSVQFEGGNLETLRYLIKKGHGYTFLPYLFIQNLTASEKEKMIRPFYAPVPSREVSLVYRKDQWKKDIIFVMMEFIKKRVPKDLIQRHKNWEVLDI